MKAKEYLEKYFPVSSRETEDPFIREHGEKMEECFKTFWNETLEAVNQIKGYDAKVRKLKEFNQKWLTFVKLYTEVFYDRIKSRTTRQEAIDFYFTEYRFMFERQVKSQTGVENLREMVAVKRENRKSHLGEPITDLDHIVQNFFDTLYSEKD